jgi:hypothetical protein
MRSVLINAIASEVHPIPGNSDNGRRSVNIQNQSYRIRLLGQQIAPHDTSVKHGGGCS